MPGAASWPPSQGGGAAPGGAGTPSWQRADGLPSAAPATPWQPSPDSGALPRPHSSRLPWVLAVVAVLALSAAGLFYWRWQQRTQMLHDVIEVEKRWNEANIRGDRQALGEVLSERYHHEMTGPKGEKTIQGKKELINGTEAKPGVKRWQLSDTRLVESGPDRAVLTGIFTEFGDGFEKRYEFSDTFVYEGGRWQALDSEWKSVTVAK